MRLFIKRMGFLSSHLNSHDTFEAFLGKTRRIGEWLGFLPKMLLFWKKFLEKLFQLFFFYFISLQEFQRDLWSCFSITKMLNCLNGLVKTGVLWSYVLVICWFLITHGPAAHSWHFFFRFFPNSVIFWDFFPQSWCWTYCITLSLAWNTLELFPFFLNVNSILLTLWLHPAGADLTILHKGDKNH